MALLPEPESFKRIADGSAQGSGAALARAVLRAASIPYGLAIAVRNAAYDAGLLASHPASIPVVSVGNLTLGGTGKTPLVAWVARRLASRGHRPAIVSRGYAARPGEVSDEAAELAVVVPGTMHVADRDRVAGVRTAAAASATVAVLDDGFQHRRLGRDLDIVAIDATDPFGCGHLFPRGLLREPLRGIRRAAAVVLTRATSVDADRRAAIRGMLADASRGGPPPAWMEAEHRPVGLCAANGRTEPLSLLQGRRVAAFAGIGNPAAFRGTLASLGCDVAAFTSFPDHHAYPAADLDRLAATIPPGVDLVVTTLKDLVKIARPTLGDARLVAVEVALRPLFGEEAVGAAIDAVAPAPPGAGAP
ncbi:MAG: tetraacyldisaccharide 4'-kinase [Planctomycetaceae bacterium]